MVVKLRLYIEAPSDTRSKNINFGHGRCFLSTVNDFYGQSMSLIDRRELLLTVDIYSRLSI